MTLSATRDVPLAGFVVTDMLCSGRSGVIVCKSRGGGGNPQASPDGLPGDEGTFSLCTFLYADALAQSGRLEDARLTFSTMLTSANHLGLSSEEIEASGGQIGNFPGAFTDLGLIAGALKLDRQLDSRSGGPVRPARRVDP